MKKIISFGKIAYQAPNRKTNLVEIEVNLVDGRLSISGKVWNHIKSDIVMGGQCLDDLLPYFKHNKKFKEIHNIWSQWHLNDLHAGTEAQEACLSTPEAVLFLSKHKKTFYEGRCEWLEQHGLLIDNNYIHNGEPYLYGSAWLKRELPQYVIDAVMSW